MQVIFKKYGYFLLVIAVISAVILVLFYDALKPKEQLPIYQPAMVNYELVDSTLQHVKKYHSIADFSLTNQNGKTITPKDYNGKIYVADFFFTTCQTICPVMTKNMAEVQEALRDQPDVLLLSHTVLPEIDSVEVLKKYAEKHHVDSSKWNLVTGDRKQIYDLARKSYLVAKEEEGGDPFAMIHTENFVLVDKQKRIRGFYDGTDKKEIEKLLHDIKILKSEDK